MKPEPTMAGESENAGTGVGLDRGSHRQSVNVVHGIKSLIQGHNSMQRNYVSLWVQQQGSYTSYTTQVHQNKCTMQVYSAFHTVQ